MPSFGGVNDMKTVKAIPIELYEQVKGERDVAVEQLKELNIELFEKPYCKVIPIWWIDSYCTDCSIGLRDNDEKKIKKLLKDWREENESV